jgi:very-short-patch-repair endonuclease
MHVTRPQLLEAGWSDGRIRRAVRDGRLVRIRPGHFADGAIEDSTRRALRLGGRLACVSELRRRGIWVLDSDIVHVHLPSNAARLRRDPSGGRRHWRPLRVPERSSSAHVGLIDALIQAWGCLDDPGWIASVDSALHLGMLRPAELEVIASALPRRAGISLALTDSASESGLETIMRVLAVRLGFRVRSQVVVPGIGRIDMIVEDWIVVETDGAAFHDLPVAAHDRRRDALLAATDRTVLRPGYSLVVHDRTTVARQLIGAVESHRRIQDSGRLASRARNRLERLGLT